MVIYYYTTPYMLRCFESNYHFTFAIFEKI